jgi:hypothetical protein
LSRRIVDTFLDEDPIANDNYRRTGPLSEFASLLARAHERRRGGLHVVVWQLGDGDAAHGLPPSLNNTGLGPLLSKHCQ